MKKLTQTAIANVLAQHASAGSVTAQQVQDVLNGASVTFAQITYVTKVALAAAHKAELIQKVTTANVMLCSNIKAHTSVYARKVKRSAANIAGNDAQAVEAFVPADTYYEHTKCYSVVQHKKDASKLYLYAIYNNAESEYVHNGSIVSKEQVAQYCTASVAKQLLEPAAVVTNKQHNITHDVQVRVISLDNIVEIKARKKIVNI